MKILKFKRCIVESDGPPVPHWHTGFGGIPVDIVREGPAGWRAALIRMGFNPDEPENARTGSLERGWQGLPRNGLIVARSINFLPGEVFLFGS